MCSYNFYNLNLEYFFLKKKKIDRITGYLELLLIDWPPKSKEEINIVVPYLSPRIKVFSG